MNWRRRATAVAYLIHGLASLSLIWALTWEPGLAAAADPAAIRLIPNGFMFARPGYLTIAVVPFGPPIASYAEDARTLVGSDIDYARQIADSLGLKANLVPIAWADWPLGLASGKFDVVIANVGVTEERKEKFDFSTYRLGVHGFYVPERSPITHIKVPADIAGLRIITNSGTIQERILLEWSRQNVAAGLRPAELLYYDDDAATHLALVSGRADAILNPDPPLALKAAKDGQIRRVGLINAGWPARADVAIASRRGSCLAQALTAATNDLIAGGAYGLTLGRWNLDNEAIDRSETNPPGLPRY